MPHATCKIHRATGAVAIASTLTATRPLVITAVRLHLDAAGGVGNFTLTLVSATAAVYNVVLLTQDMTTTTDVFWVPDQPIPVANGDGVIAAYANANSKTYGLEISYKYQV